MSDGRDDGQRKTRSQTSDWTSQRFTKAQFTWPDSNGDVHDCEFALLFSPVYRSCRLVNRIREPSREGSFSLETNLLDVGQSN